MKQYLKTENLPALTVLAGGIGLLLRIWQLNSVTDKGFIIRGHISGILLTLLCIGFVAMAFSLASSLQQGTKYSFNFPASAIGGAGSAVAAAGIAITCAVELSIPGNRLNTLCCVLGIAAAAALAFAGYCRWKGLKPSMLLHTMLCVWLVLRLICLYRSWSSDPQLADYCCQLLAVVCAMLTAYQRSAFDANMGRRDHHSFFSLAGVFFCILSLAGPDGAVLYLSLGVWMFTDLCNLRSRPKRRRREFP